MVEGGGEMVVQMDSGFAEDAIHFDPCDAVFIAGEVAVRGKFKIHIAACTVRTGGAVSSYEVVAVDGNKIAFNEDSFVFVVAEVHEPVVDLCHIPLIADDDVYVVVNQSFAGPFPDCRDIQRQDTSIFSLQEQPV